MTDKSALDFLTSFEECSKNLRKLTKKIKLDKKETAAKLYSPWVLSENTIIKYLATLKAPEKLIILMLLIRNDDDLLTCDDIFKQVDSAIVGLIIDQIFYS